MQRLVKTLVALSAAALLAALTAPGLGAQAEAKEQPPPAAEKKQAAAAPKHVMIADADLKWGPTPEGLPPGGQLAVLDGDPGKAGLFSIRIKLPDGYMVPPHWHPTDEHVTVLSGNLMVGIGSKWDDSALHNTGAGTYAKMPRRMNHYVKTKGETVFQLTAMGPFVITYVNASDDPRKKKTE
jgi:hypothetical protein